MGLMGVDAMRTAVMPVWDEIGIDDIFSAIRLQRTADTFTLHQFLRRRAGDSAGCV